MEVLEPLSEHLARHTTTPAQVYYALWIGFADPGSFRGQAPEFTLPAREYLLVTGPISALPRVIESPWRHVQSPNLAWPADRAWCLATEIDFRWTYTGGSSRLIADLLADERIEALPTMPEHRGDIESDWPVRG